MSKNILEASLEGAEHIVLLGHIHPDGDCIGTTLGLLNYLRENCFSTIRLLNFII